MVETAVEIGGERVLARVATGSVPAVVPERDGLGEGHALERRGARLLPERDCFWQQVRLGVVVRQQVGLGRFSVRQTFLDDPGDLAVQLLPAPSKQRVVGGVLHQRVLEGVKRIGRRALLERQPRLGQLGQRLVQLRL